jgi:hypothetical protein
MSLRCFGRYKGKMTKLNPVKRSMEVRNYQRLPHLICHEKEPGVRT